MTDTAFWVLFALLAGLTVWLLLDERRRDLNGWVERQLPPEPDAELRCFFCHGHPGWCTCRDELPTK